MTRRVAAIVLFASGLSPSPAMTQTRGLPVQFRDVMKGFGAGLDFSVDSSFRFLTVALSGTAALGHLTRSDAEGKQRSIRLFNVSATLGHFGAQGGSPDGWTIGGAVNLSGQLQVGADYSRSEGTGRVHLIPISVMPVALDCIGTKTNVHVWVGFGWDFEHVSGQVGGWKRPWTSFSGGIGLDLRNGLGFGLATGGPNTGVPFDPYRQWTLNLGLRYSRHNIVTEAFPQDRGCHVTPIL